MLIKISPRRVFGYVDEAVVVFFFLETFGYKVTRAVSEVALQWRVWTS